MGWIAWFALGWLAASLGVGLVFSFIVILGRRQENRSRPLFGTAAANRLRKSQPPEASGRIAARETTN